MFERTESYTLYVHLPCWPQPLPPIHLDHQFKTFTPNQKFKQINKFLHTKIQNTNKYTLRLCSNALNDINNYDRYVRVNWWYLSCVLISHSFLSFVLFSTTSQLVSQPTKQTTFLPTSSLLLTLVWVAIYQTDTRIAVTFFVGTNLLMHTLVS